MNWRSSLLLLGLASLASFGHAATLTAKSCSQSDIQVQLDAAVDGDIVQVPEGTCTWSTRVNIGSSKWNGSSNDVIRKAVTLRGAGIGKTIILDNIPVNNTSAAMMHIYAPKNGIVRLTGFTFGTAPGTKVISYAGKIKVVGDGSRYFRIDHNEFAMKTNDRAIYITGWPFGVIDHNTFSGVYQAVTGFYRSWGGGATSDGSWAAPLSLGSDQAIYVEDNQILEGHGSIFDGWEGVRVVVRNNFARDGSFQSHGTESGGRFRGIFSYEIYNNTFKLETLTNKSDAIHIRGGTGVIFNNNIIGNYSNIVRHRVYRMTDEFVPWGACVGNNPWDLNDEIVYDAGTHNGAAVANGILSDSTKNWAPNQWKGYSLVNETLPVVKGVITGLTGSTIFIDTSKSWTKDKFRNFYVKNLRTNLSIPIVSNTANSVNAPNNWKVGDAYEIYPGWGSRITGNDAHTISVENSVYGRSRDWKSGDRYEIFRVNRCLDQSGAGPGILLSGYESSGNMGPVGWPEQTTEPVYSWNNQKNGKVSDAVSTAASYMVQSGRDLMPGVCRPGYTPFTYPHPVVQQQDNVPAETIELNCPGGTSPQIGRCGSTANTCLAGSFADLTDSEGQYLWSCMGLNGGADVSCVLPKNPVTLPSSPNPIEDSNGSSEDGDVSSGFLRCNGFFNPMKESLEIQFAQADESVITIFNRQGAEVKNIETASSHIIWDGRVGTEGAYVPAGSYMIVLKQNGRVIKRKVVVVK